MTLLRAVTQELPAGAEPGTPRGELGALMNNRNQNPTSGDSRERPATHEGLT